ncbi:PSF2 [Hepatospora eriocheir]|uniref:PSF2 n=1 Tax=Hepatospora eriocheir TaxID=1081669 RepID=A0A1X0QEE3_9MICR|nr:PSF2 [Hepatospora eriocheir]
MSKELLNIALEILIEVEGKSNIKSSNKFNTKYFNGIQIDKLTKMPLYMAIHLQNLDKLTIILPAYYEDSLLDEIIENENEVIEFTTLPCEYFFEVAKLLKVDNPKIERIATIRKNKLFFGISKLEGKSVQINNLTRWEFCEVKEFILEIMKIGSNIKVTSND